MKELTFPCTLEEVRLYWRVPPSTFGRWMQNLKKANPGIRWYGKRGHHTRLTKSQFKRLEAAIWYDDSTPQEPERATKHGSFAIGSKAASTRAARARRTREIGEAVRRKLSFDTPEPPQPPRLPFRRFP